MELRTVNTFLHIAELHSFFPHCAAAGLLAVGGVLPKLHSWKPNWAPRCLTAWAKRYV